MSSQSMLDQARFWEIIKYLVQLDHKENFNEVCKDLDLSGRQLNTFVNFLKEVNYEIEHYTDGEERQLCPPIDKPKITLEFNILEWLQFQAHFPALSANEGKPYHEEFVAKLGEVEQEYSQHDLFAPMDTLNGIMQMQSPQIVEGNSLPKNEIISFIEESIIDDDVLNIHMNEKNFLVYPRKIVFLDGDLSLVSEGLNDKCLLNINIDSITQVHEEDIEWTPQFSKLEIEDFVSSIRAISENEIRLVLKVYNREHFDNGVPHHHFDRPCMFTNPDGDFIWAASIEPTEEIHEWLSQLGTDVEILDPIDFKKEFLSYCEGKLKKLA